MKSSQDSLSDLFIACKQHGMAPQRFVLVVSIAEQIVSLYENASVPLRFDAREHKLTKQILCSTSRFGVGQTEGSNRTPLGLHRIGEKIGAGEPAGTVFKARQIIGHTSQPEF